MGGEMPALGLIGNIPKNKIKKSQASHVRAGNDRVPED